MRASSMKYEVCLVLIWFSSIQLLKKHTLNPEMTLLYQSHAQKALFKASKICNINFWIENDPPPFGTFPKIHPFCTVTRSLHESFFPTWNFPFLFVQIPIVSASKCGRHPRGTLCAGGRRGQGSCTVRQHHHYHHYHLYHLGIIPK